MSSIEEYRQRRAERLAARGLVEAERDSRFPLSLLKEHAITPLVWWSYKDAWAALAAKGVTPASVYRQLKQKGVPETEDAIENELQETQN